jgi:tripartite-type tricarboxylate transporter receptor subunit TctC
VTSRPVVSAIALLVGLAISPVLAESDYPSRPVRLIVGFIPGSAADITARVLGNRLSQKLGQQFVIETKPGAGSSLAAESVARAPQDDYTLLIGTSANVTNAAINPNLAFDLGKDFAPIAAGVTLRGLPA